jgi:dihydroneopterin aldolase
VGKSPTELLEELTNTIADLLIKRQDAAPVQVRVTSAKVKKHRDVDKTLKEFITE